MTEATHPVNDYDRAPAPVKARRVGFGEPAFCQVMDFLTDEARLLNEGHFEEWLELLADDLRYTMPVRRTVLRGDESIDPHMLHFDDDLASVRMRVWRVTRSEYAYAENPASRVRYFITNVEVYETPDPVELAVRSSELVLRSRWDTPVYDIISCHRDDLLRRDDVTTFKLARREIITDQATIGTPNLAIML